MNTETTPLLEYFKQQIGKATGSSGQAPPFTQWLNGTLQKVEMGSFTMEFVVRKEMTNPLGLLHGGVQAAILDDMIGMTVAALPKDTPAVSINLSVDFIGKAVEGEKIIATSQVVRQGRQVIYILGEIVSAEGKLIAKATSNMLVIKK
ncbi:MAG: PaaI family thioesterase [Cytophagales bacterium]|nr:MAG: PaaI family thioesterase [Cytophagales bacterium]